MTSTIPLAPLSSTIFHYHPLVYSIRAQIVASPSQKERYPGLDGRLQILKPNSMSISAVSGQHVARDKFEVAAPARPPPTLLLVNCGRVSGDGTHTHWDGVLTSGPVSAGACTLGRTAQKFTRNRQVQSENAENRAFSKKVSSWSTPRSRSPITSTISLGSGPKLRSSSSSD